MSPFPVDVMNRLTGAGSRTNLECPGSTLLWVILLYEVGQGRTNQSMWSYALPFQSTLF